MAKHVNYYNQTKRLKWVSGEIVAACNLSGVFIPVPDILRVTLF